MQSNPTFETACIRAFSKVTASISHEIKNTMAIINENAGLLDDLVMMSGGESVSAERVKGVSATITRQVKRTNAIMNHLNRFAHSADHETGQESLHDILSLTVSLTVRQAAAKNLEIGSQCPDDVQINTRLLPFHALMYLTLRLLIDHSDYEDKLAVTGTMRDGAVSVSFTAPCITEEFMTSFSKDELQALLPLLNAESRRENDCLLLTIPSVEGAET